MDNASRWLCELLKKPSAIFSGNSLFQPVYYVYTQTVDMSISAELLFLLSSRIVCPCKHHLQSSSQLQGWAISPISTAAKEIQPKDIF